MLKNEDVLSQSSPATQCSCASFQHRPIAFKHCLISVNPVPSRSCWALLCSRVLHYRQCWHNQQLMQFFRTVFQICCQLYQSLFRNVCCIKCVQVISQVSLTEDGYLSDDAATHIICTQYLFDQMAVCVVTSTGDIILWNVTSNEVWMHFDFFAYCFVHIFCISCSTISCGVSLQ